MAASLNSAQREAVHTLSGPLLVLAGAGTGKTRVVTYRIAELIRRGIRAERILGVTFTNKAADEMQQRAGKLLGSRMREKPEISTFHSLCVRVLRRNIRRLGYPAEFAIYDRGDQEGVARGALREIRVPNELMRPSDLVNQIGRWKTAGVRPETAESVAASDREHLAAAAYRRYQATLKASGAVDFDDLLLLVEELFTRYEDCRRAEAARFDHLLVDEYQDTNGPQYRIVKALATGHRNLCVVGDDDQSIYGWRGADVNHILHFTRDWPDARVVRLEDNYRSRAPIIELANRLIAYNKHRHGKVLRAARREGDAPRILQFEDENAEARGVVEEIRALLEARQAAPRDFAILFRTNEQPRPLEMELRRVKLPYILIGGQSFYDRKEVRDVLAYLKLVAHPQDEVALLRIINTPPRGLGTKAVERLMAEAAQSSRQLWDVLAASEEQGTLPAAAAAGVRRLRHLVEVHRAAAKNGSLVEMARRLLTAVGYRGEIERLYKDPQEQQVRWNSVEEVVNALAAYEKRAKRPSLGGFLDDVALAGREEQDDKESKLQRNAVVLMTLHSAKGLEFPRVYLVGMEEGLLPHHRSITADGSAIDEERRLCYVGVTRAQDELTLTLALGRHKWGKCRTTIPSRFIYELLGKADQPQAVEHRRRATREFRRGGHSSEPKKTAASPPAASGTATPKTTRSKADPGQAAGRRKHSPSTRQRASKRAR